MKRIFQPFHLFAIALYPLLFLFTNNREAVPWQILLRPLLVSLALILLLYVLAGLCLKSWSRAALLATLAWALFSLYGHLYQALRASTGLSLLGKHSTLGPLVALLGVILLVGVVRSRGELRNSHLFLNGILAVLLIFPVFQLVRGMGGAASPQAGQTEQLPGRAPLALSDTATKPDVYYMVVDTYSRADVIEKHIGLDIGPFLEGLRQRGFVTSECSLSNYDSTRVSLASSLNMDFIPNLDHRFTPDNPDNGLLDDYILHSRVRSTFEALGYQTVAFATGFAFTEWTDASRYLAPPDPPLLTAPVQPFEALWLKTTAMRALFDIHPSFLSALLNELSFPHGAHVARQQYLFDTLPQLSQMPGPKFVFAHILLPHVPLVFRADGSITTDDRYFRETFDQPVSEEYLIDGYRNQVQYLNQRLLDIIDALQRQSATPPVIILQGDHGLLYYEHNAVLNAYSLPGVDSSAIYPTITPVNTFRVLFNQYFNAELPLLPDEAFTSSYTLPYDFQPAAVPCPVE